MAAVAAAACDLRDARSTYHHSSESAAAAAADHVCLQCLWEFDKSAKINAVAAAVEAKITQLMMVVHGG